MTALHGAPLAPEALGPTVAIGEVLVEIVAVTLGEGFCETQPLLGPYASGAPAIFLDQCAKMGAHAAMIGVVGNDDFGRLCLERMSRDNVDVSAVSIDDERPTGSAFVRYRDDGARKFIFNIAHSAAGQLRRSPAVDQMVASAGHLHVAGSTLGLPGAMGLMLDAASSIKRRGGTVSFDPNLRPELLRAGETGSGIGKLLSISDLLLPSGEELQDIAGLSDESAAIAKMFDLGVKEIALKRGRFGATVFQPDGGRMDATVFDVDEVDPTGAGDCFGGAYVAACRLGLPPWDCLTYACAAGARNVTVRGPMEGVGTRAELDTLIRSKVPA